MEIQVGAALQGFDNKLSLERCYDALQQLRFETHAPLQQLSPHLIELNDSSRPLEQPRSKAIPALLSDRVLHSARPI
jgi:hypothetical protein